MDIGEVTQEQLDALEGQINELKKFKDESAPKLEQYNKAVTDLEQLKKDKADLEGQVNPNWAKARDKMSRLESLLKGKGIEIDEDGNPKSGGGSDLNLEKVQQVATETARKELLGDRLEELLDEFDSDSKEVVRHFFNKLTTGEQVTLKNIKGFVIQAENAAKGGEKKLVRLSGGQGPRTSISEEEQKLSDEAAKDLGSKLGLPFAAPSKK